RSLDAAAFVLRHHLRKLDVAVDRFADRVLQLLAIPFEHDAQAGFERLFQPEDEMVRLLPAQLLSRRQEDLLLAGELDETAGGAAQGEAGRGPDLEAGPGAQGGRPGLRGAIGAQAIAQRDVLDRPPGVLHESPDTRRVVLLV